jgi:hypothetical protein
VTEEKKMRVIKYAVAIALVSSSSAFAGFFEVEGNNTAATANPLPLTSCFQADVGLASLAAGGGDLDYYSVVVPTNCYLTAITTPLSAYPSSPDTVMDLRTAADVNILTNDDDSTTNSAVPGGSAGTNRGSAIRLFNSGPAAVFLLRVRGFDNTVTGNYALTVSLVPEPSTLALLGLGAVALIRRRK